MAESHRPLFVCRSFLLLAMCVLLLITLHTQQVKNSVAYVTSVSTTCVNLFTTEEHPGPSVSSQPEPPPAPPTGGSIPVAPLLAAMLFSLAATVVLFSMGRKRYAALPAYKNHDTRRKRQ